MKISKSTIELLINFAQINEAIFFRSSDHKSFQSDWIKSLSTISPRKNILVEAVIEDDIEKDFAIYDLGRFLSVIKEMNEPDLTLKDDHLVISSNGSKTKYMYAESNMLVTPPEKSLPKNKEAGIEFVVNKDKLQKIEKMSSVMNLPDVGFVGDNTELYIETYHNKSYDKNNTKDDVFSIDLGTTDKEFNLMFKAENLKLLPGDYTVEVLIFRKDDEIKGGMGEFTHNDRKLKYWIAAETESIFGIE